MEVEPDGRHFPESVLRKHAFGYEGPLSHHNKSVLLLSRQGIDLHRTVEVSCGTRGLQKLLHEQGGHMTGGMFSSSPISMKVQFQQARQTCLATLTSDKLDDEFLINSSCTTGVMRNQSPRFSNVRVFSIVEAGRTTLTTMAPQAFGNATDASGKACVEQLLGLF
jgi:hypothetical protein